MKRNLKVLTIAVFLVIAPLMMFAQPHPNGGAAPNPGTNQKVGEEGAPIGDGVFILFTLALGYAGRRVYKMRTAEE